MKTTIAYLLAAAALLTLEWTLLPRQSAPASQTPETPEALLLRGQYLVKLGGCTDCHTPKLPSPQGPVDDPLRRFAGHPAEVMLAAPGIDPDNPWEASTAGMTAWTGPWGVSFASNLTPDPETGLGNWSEQEFIATLRSGRHKGTGRPILPPMPWQPLSEATDEDLAAIFAYLMSLPAVPNRVPAPQPPVAASTAGNPRS